MSTVDDPGRLVEIKAKMAAYRARGQGPEPALADDVEWLLRALLLCADELSYERAGHTIDQREIRDLRRQIDQAQQEASRGRRH